MATQTSLKELSKAISAFIPEPTVPLPEDLIETIAAYLRRHQKYEEAAADRLHEELQTIFDKHVRHNHSASGAWIGILRRLLPMIQTPERIVAWMDNFKGLLTRQSYDRSIVEETSAALMDLVALADEYQDISENDTTINPIMHRVFLAWMERFYPATVEGVPGMEYNERMFREALMQFGKKRPKQLFASLDGFFVQKDHRRAALRFFCDFVQTRPPHLHQVLQIPLFNSLLTCLHQDTSTAVVSAALTALIMLLPHMPSSLVPHLPALFNIYARILFWGRDKTDIEGEYESRGDTQWEVCSYAPDVEDASITHLSNYYTILYGLYPLNFMDYIRKPQRYLRHANVANADDMAVQPSEIRQQSEKFRRCHLLHPNFFTLTIDSEKTDFGRFIKSEASEVVAECQALHLSPGSHYSTGEDEAGGLFIIQSPADDSEHATSEGILLNRSLSIDNRSESPLIRAASNTSLPAPAMARHNSQSSQASTNLFPARSRDSGLESTSSPPPYLPTSSSHTYLQDMIQSNKVIKSGLAQSLRNDSEASLPLNHQDLSNEKQNGTQGGLTSVNEPMSSTELDSQVRTQIALLQRQNLMLQNDLSFERYQKQQHMAHIADLRRKLVAEAATEAETQNLIMTSRNLKRRYDESKQAEMQVRKESEKSRTLAKKWEATLASKMKKLREEFEQTKNKLEQVGKELEISHQEADKLRRMVCVGEVKELNWKQNVQFIELHAVELDNLKTEVERLTVVERDNQAKEMIRQTRADEAHEAEKKVETLSLQLAAQDNDVQQTREALQGQIKELQSELLHFQDNGGRSGAANKANVQSLLAGSRAKQAELQHQYDLLKRKYTALLSSVLDMESGNTPEQIRNEALVPHAPALMDDYLSSPTAPPQMRMQPRRGPMSPQMEDATAYNTTPPLETKPKGMPPTSAGSSQGSQRPSTPSGQGVEGQSAGSSDPRLFGRGGVQNKIRKDGKGKGKEDDNPPPNKKEKKSGLRGIRGLV